MNFFSKFFRSEPSESGKSVEQALIVHFDYGQPGLDPLHALEDKLIVAITEADVGEYDGHEIAMDLSDGFLYMYGPDAYRLYTVVAPVLESSSFMIGATARLRFGPPVDGVREEFIKIKPPSIS